MRTAILAAAALLVPAAAVAGSIEPEVLPKVLAGGKDRPTVVLHAVEDCADVLVKLSRDDGKTIGTRTGPMAAGTSKKIPLDLPEGREYKFTGTLEVKSDRGEESIEVSFVAEVVVPAKLSLNESKFSLEKRELELSSTRKTSKVDVEVTSDRGEEIGTTTVPFDGAAPGTPLKVQWRQDDGTVMRIKVKVWDTDNFFQSVELFPWHILIPHEEINFPTGSFKIEAKEEPKLTSSVTLIQEAVEKYGRFAEIKLYVAGHTDSVGASETNRTLSLNRARAISEFFRRHGIRVPILYDGFGEDALRIPTPDETDEVRNRRAEYIVAVEPPPVPYSRQANWKPLR
ncbi:MAG: OmpA family protein [Deltaproteobacteria bacterium]|nr:OmpA family protein [Deltaproteobacteria bacterium]